MLCKRFIAWDETLFLHGQKGCPHMRYRSVSARLARTTTGGLNIWAMVSARRVDVAQKRIHQHVCALLLRDVQA